MSTPRKIGKSWIVEKGILTGEIVGNYPIAIYLSEDTKYWAATIIDSPRIKVQEYGEVLNKDFNWMSIDKKYGSSDWEDVRQYLLNEILKPKESKTRKYNELDRFVDLEE